MKNLSENLVILFFSILLLLVGFLVASPSMASPLISEVTNETSNGAINQVMADSHATTVASDQAYININTASAAEIAAAIRGIGLKKADAIVAYRRTHGPFKTVEGLTAVKGVGNKTLLRNKDVIRIE